MTLEYILNALSPLLHEGESATITESDDFGDRMIAVEGTARKTNIYDYGGMYVWYSQPGGGAWADGDTDAMSEQLTTMLDYARTSPRSGDLREQEAREMTPTYLLERLSDLLAGGAPAITGTLPDGTEVAEIDYGPGAIHIEKGRNSDFSAWAITRSHRWPASKRDLSQAREAITDILTAIKPTN
jgi:hypothetical protein|nr:MAG TPA: hypothetical protein [Caudoviricetes sp.]